MMDLQEFGKFMESVSMMNFPIESVSAVRVCIGRRRRHIKMNVGKWQRIVHLGLAFINLEMRREF